MKYPNKSKLCIIGAALYRDLESAGEELRKYPKEGPLGLTPDHIKALPEYKNSKLRHAEAFEAVRRYNQSKRKKTPWKP